MTTGKIKTSTTRWSSQLAFILSATGAAVGLGNIWKFPYEVGANGGSAFVLTYVLLLICLGIPLLITEMLLGKLGRANPIATMVKLSKKAQAHPAWRLIGYMNIMTLILVLSFYSVVAGWSIKYVYISMSGALNHASKETVALLWSQTIANPKAIIAYHALFMGLTISVVMQGLKQGIERANQILMPMLFLCLVLLVINNACAPGFAYGWHYLFDFNAQAINTQTIIHAMGQTCFTLAIGAGCMLVYGAYVEEHTNLCKTATTVAMCNLFVAILVGLAIFPLVFRYGLKPTAGPGLIFETLPIAFASMPMGSILATIFFLLILFAAWTSSISIAEPVVLMLIEQKGLTRSKAACTTGILTWALGLFSALSFNVWQNIHFFGYNNFFTAVTTIATDICLPLGILGFTLFAGWQLPKQLLLEHIGTKYTLLLQCWYISIRFISPICVVTVLWMH